MKHTVIKTFVMLGIIMCLISLGSSQITLSKGWGPGKRSINDDTCRPTTRFMTTFCRTLTSELRRLIACELRDMSTAVQPDEGIPWPHTLDTKKR